MAANDVTPPRAGAVDERTGGGLPTVMTRRQILVGGVAATLAAVAVPAVAGADTRSAARPRSQWHGKYATSGTPSREGIVNGRAGDELATSLQLLADRMEIRRVVDEIDNAVDAKDWTTCRGYFTDEIYADFTSLAGGSPGRIPADALVAGWSTALFSAKLSHHMRSNHRITVDGDRAAVFSRGYALNILASKNGSDLWEVWGDYVHTLERTPQGWKCTGMTFTVTHARGNERVRDFVPPR
jgi:ketosteroid isomerase-like protein